mgnify:FL=1
MEVIEVTSYTENEKLHIAQEHLIPKQIEKHGLKADQLTISKNAIWKMARNYTKEAGVRQLERKIGDICRKSAMEILEKKKKSIHVTERNMDTIWVRNFTVIRWQMKKMKLVLCVDSHGQCRR